MARIYVSSTFNDLKEFRELVRLQLRQMEHEDIAMEYYVAENQRPLDKCLKDVASCDLYIGIFAQRYGYTPPEQQKSITELEYRAAFDKGKDRLIFLLDEEASWPTKFVDKGKDAEKIASLRNELSQENLVSFFNNPHELKSLIATAVHKWEKKDEEKKDEEKKDEEIFKPMESFVQDALKFKEKEKLYKQTTSCSPEEMDEFGTPKIVVVGCGGGGNSTINRLYNIGIAGADTLAINTDKKHLDITKADKKILIGKSITRGLGAGGFPEVGRRAAELSRGTLEEVLKDANLVFVTAGIGGGTGTGIAPVVAQIAKDQGAIVIGMVTCPFKVERSRLFKAGEGLYELGKAANTVIVIDNNRFLDYVPNLPIDQVFSVIDQLISETVKGITETITQPSLMNFDYADIRAIMCNGGLAILLVGEAKGQDKAKKVVRAALKHPLLDLDTKGARGCLLHITGGTDMSLHEAEQIASSLTYELDPHAKVIWGARVKKEYEGKVRCIAIMTGLISDSKVNNSLNNGFIKQLKSISSKGSTNVRVTRQHLPKMTGIMDKIF